MTRKKLRIMFISLASLAFLGVGVLLTVPQSNEPNKAGFLTCWLPGSENKTLTVVVEWWSMTDSVVRYIPKGGTRKNALVNVTCYLQSL